jgi:WD40 repeat protein
LWGGAGTVAVAGEPLVAVPATPYRGIHPFRYADHAIFFAREEETRLLASLAAVYRGVFLYGDSGSGKSSLVSAALLPRAYRLGFAPVRVRVQPRVGEELVIEPIVRSDDGTDVLPCVLAPEHDGSSRVVLSIAEFEARVRAVADEHRPVLVFDQFEEILTLFEDADAIASRRVLAEMIVRLLREPLRVKLLFVFREDYLGRVKQLLAACPELVDHALRLGPPSADELQTIIRGPFERFPGRFGRELDPALAQTLRAALAERFGIGEVSLSEVQTVCLRLWQSSDPAALLAEKGVQGILEDDLGEALDALPSELRAAAVALLGQMVTSAGTRNVISADDLRQHVQEEDEEIAPQLLDEALDRLERDSKLVRRERRHDVYLYEITSEFLVPWISKRSEELRREQERQRERHRLRIVVSIAGALLILVALIAALAIWALGQRDNARRRATQSNSLALASSASSLLDSRPDVSLLLAFEAYNTSPRVEARSSVLAALSAVAVPAGLAILRGHTEVVWNAAFSPDGRMLASVSDDETVRLWDVRTHEQLGEPLRGHTGSVFSVAFSPDGRVLASASADKTVRLWDVRTHEQLGRPLRGHTDSVSSVAFSPDGRVLASASNDKTVRLWDVRTHEQLGRPLKGHTDLVDSVAFSPDGRTLASSGRDNTIRLWDARTHKPRGQPLRGHKSRVLSVAFSPDGRTLASASYDKTIRLWDTRTHKPLGQPLRGHTDAVDSVAFSPDGDTLASASYDKTIRLWNARTHKPRGEPLNGHTAIVDSVAFSPDGRMLASASDDKTIRLWDARVPSPRDQRLRGHTDAVDSVAFSPDGRMLASASADKTIRLWDTRTHKGLGRPLMGHTESVDSVAFSPDGRMLASASDDKTIRLWDTRTHKPFGQPLRGHDSFVFDVVFSPDGHTLASASEDATVRIWDVGTHRQLGPPLTGHEGFVFGVAFSHDGRTLASVSQDATVRLWDVGTHKQLGTPLIASEDSVLAVAFSPDGRTLASASADKTIRVYEKLLWRDLTELQSRVCGLLSTGLSKPEWEQNAAGIPYRQSCP